MKNQRRKKKEEKKEGKRERKKGKQKGKMGKIDENIGNKQGFHIFFPQAPSNFHIFPHDDMITGKHVNIV